MLVHTGKCTTEDKLKGQAIQKINIRKSKQHKTQQNKTTVV